MKASLRELINTNAAEKEAKIIYAMKINIIDSFGDQMDYIKRQAGKFVSNKYEMEGANGGQQTDKVIEIIALGHIIANIPQDMDGILKNKVRTLLLPTMEGIKNFDWDKTVTEIKAYEKTLGLFKKKKQIPNSHFEEAKKKEGPTQRKGWPTPEERRAMPNLDQKVVEKIKKTRLTTSPN